MWVAATARGAGVGTTLVEAVAEWARSSGARSVSLSVKATNSHAIALYERLGFELDNLVAPDAADERRMIRPITTR